MSDTSIVTTTTIIQGPAKAPCGSCPYRQDVPPGVWHSSEYDKLPLYDRETFNQPMSLFMCHQQDGRLCAGWVGCHDMDQSLAVRMARVFRLDQELHEEVLDYVSPVPLWDSGRQAAEHGRQAVTDKARHTIDKLKAKRDRKRS